MADQALVSLCNFLSTYLLARYLPISDFGLYATVFVGLMFLNSLQDGVFIEPLTVLGAKKSPRVNRLFTAVLGTAQVAGALLVCVLLGTAGLLVWRFASSAYGQLLVLAGAAAAPWMAQEFVRRTLYANLRSKAACANDLVSYSLQLGGIVSMLFLWDARSVQLAIAILGASSLVAVLFGVWQLRTLLSFADWSLEAARDMWAEAWEFGRWLVAKHLVSWFGSQGHSWLLLALMGPAAVGIYKAGKHPLNILNPIRYAAGLYMTPRASRAFATEGIAGLQRRMRLMYLLAGIPTALIILAVAVFAGPILYLAYGEKFTGTGIEWVLVTSGAAQLIGFCQAPLRMAILVMGRTKALFWTGTASAVLLLTVGILLIRFLGVLGAPLSSLLISTVVLICLKLIYSRERNDLITAVEPTIKFGMAR